jgi:formylglycine-generating enzyme required for sulfatase activity
MKKPAIHIIAILLSQSAALAADDVAAMKQLKAPDWTVPGIGMKMKLVPAGSFIMGSPENEPDRRADEIQHKVTISRPFYMGAYEVTQKQHYDLMLPDFDHDSWQYARGPVHAGTALFYRSRKGRSDYEGGELNLQQPMECVTWEKAREFCQKINRHEREAGRLPEGYVYRLPTEAEWEYACRAGSKGSYNVKGAEDTADYLRSRKYLKSFANVGEGKPINVGQGKPSAWGLYDMHGNVYEWCLDWDGPYPTVEVKDPTGPAEGEKRVARG